MPNDLQVMHDPPQNASRVTLWLSQASPALFSTYTIVAAFGLYFAMYAFRKPFTAAAFDAEYGGMGYKSILVISQVMGYTLSKFIGIRVISEMPAARRATMLILMVAIAHVALLLFAITPAPWNAGWLFVNGLPLGLVFGLVLSFLEGRRVTEALTAGLCASFIVSGGVVKSVGQSLLLYGGVSEFWMPFVTALIFWPFVLVCLWMLSQIPPPSQADIEHRATRDPISQAERKEYLRRHGKGLLLLVTVFMLLTVLRSLRDDFAVEIWAALGSSEQPAIYSQSESLVMLLVVAINGGAFLIQDNRRAFYTALATIGGGFFMIALSTLALQQQSLSGFAFMVLLGVGTYVPYVAFHTTLFERMIALFRDRANLGYLMYLADAFGYLGYIAVLLLKNFGTQEIDFLRLLTLSSLVISGVSLLFVVWAALSYRNQLRGVDLLVGEGKVAAEPASS